MSYHLFEPFLLGDLSLKNRIVMAPLTRARAGEERIPNVLMAQYYGQRASAGLIISEATVISEQGIGWPNTPGIYNDAQVGGWRLITDAVHRRGGQMFLQLWHCGRASHSSFHHGAPPVAPSALRIEGDHIHTPNGKQAYETPRALSTDEVQAVVEDYRLAAIRAKQAGFDGIEIHGANGYLINTFLDSATNHRTDAYGGSQENRFRFLKEIVDAVLTVWPAQRVGVRFSPNGNKNSMGAPDFRESYLYFANQLNAYGLAYLHIMDGLGFGFHGYGQPMTLSEFKVVFTGPIIGNVGYDEHTAGDAIARGEANLIAFGRPFISNPDLVCRLKNQWPLSPLADTSVWYSFDSKGYADFPTYEEAKMALATGS